MGYGGGTMNRTSPEAPIHRDPEQRFQESVGRLVFLTGVFVEVVLGFSVGAAGSPGSGLLHVVAAGLFLVGLGALRKDASRTIQTLLFLAFAWSSSVISLFFGPDIGAVVWHFLIPIGVLLLKGPRWGWTVLAVDFLFTALQIAQFTPSFDALGTAQTLPWLLAGWEVSAIVLYILLSRFLENLRQTFESFQSERGQVLDQLTLSRDSEARWADQARFLETLMDVIPFPLFHKGVDGRYISANASFRVVFDVQKEAITGQRNESLLRAENAKTLAKIELDLLARDSMAVEETVLIHADGLPHDFVVYLMPFVDENHQPLGSIGVLVDITDRKQRESKLEQLNNTKDQLFSIISHDLRGPVGKLKQLLDIYVDDPSIFDKATWDQVFHDMRRSADSLFQLLENLLSWARSQQGQGQVRYTSVALEPLIGDIYSVLKLLAADKKITLEMAVHLEGPILTDRDVLSTILRNLIHNALKFTSPGGKIIVTAEETPDDLWIEVRDTGIGMDEETVTKLFQRKERHSTFGTGKERGQGIGLGLCRDLARSIGAHLEVESHLGRGTAIKLHLPTPEL